MKRLIAMIVVAAALPTAAQDATKSTAVVSASGAWTRATVPGQRGTGAFMTLTSATGARLVGAASPAAGVVEIHEMVMEGNVMKMRAVAGVDLPPGRSVELGPGGYHVMLMDLKRPLATGDRVRIDLHLETRDRRMVTQPIDVEVRAAPPEKHGAHKH